MNLIRFLLIGSILTIILGEFGHFPFGSPSSIGLIDVFVITTNIFFLIWKIGIKRDINIPKIFFPVILFWIIGLISLIYSSEFSGGLYLIRFILYSNLFLVAYFIGKAESLEKILSVVLFSGLFLSVIGFLQIIFYPDLKVLTDFGYDPHINRLVSSFLDPNFLGAYLNICLLIAGIRIKQFNDKNLFFFAVILAAIILTFSRSAYLMLVLELGFFCLFKAKKYLLLIGLIFFMLYFLFPMFQQRVLGGFNLDQSSKERVESWNRGYIVFTKNPVIGIGFNNLRSYYQSNNLIRTFSQDGGHSGAGVDSSFLYLLATTGIIGFTVLISWYIYILFLSLKSYKNKTSLLITCIIIGLFVNSQFINSLFYPPVMLVLFSMLGLWAKSKI